MLEVAGLAAGYLGERVVDGIDLEELLSRLSDLLLSSGFDDGYSMPGEDGLSMQSLHDAIMEALLNGGLLSEETLERLLGKDWQTSEDAEERLDELIRRIIEKLQHQGYVSTSPDIEAERQRRERGLGRDPYPLVGRRLVDRLAQQDQCGNVVHASLLVRAMNCSTTCP